MTVVIIGENTAPLKNELIQCGIDAIGSPAGITPSLTILPAKFPEVTHIVLLPEAQKSWSMAHILSASRMLQGGLIYYGCSSSPAPVIQCANNCAELLELLKPKKPAAKADTSGGKGLPVTHPPQEVKPPEVKPLETPPGSILFLGIIGSQSRIGCTTQAIALWHYCKKLGFDPAIVSSELQISDMAAVMHHQEINGGYQIESIPFVTNTSLSYDCYILDLGIDNVRDTIERADYLFLVAGSKPWELQHTSAALRMIRGMPGSILLSFSCQRDADDLMPLFDGRQIGVLPWMQNIWNPSTAILAFFDQLLRPVLKRCLIEKQRENETENEITYEEENKQ